MTVTQPNPNHPLWMEDDDTYDPFTAFDEAMGKGAVRDPHGAFARLRDRCPVQPDGAINAELGVEVGFDMNTFGNENPGFAVYSHDAVQQVLRDGETFSSAGYAASIGLVFGHSILEMDEPEHHRHRSLVTQAFTRKSMEKWERDIVRPIVNDFIDQFIDRGHADLVKELTFPFPVKVIAAMLGLPAEDLPLFHRRAVEVISLMVDPMRGYNSAQKLGEYFKSIIDERRVEPRDDVISVLAHAEVKDDDGTSHVLTDDEILAFLRLLLPAGAETTYRSSSNLFFGLMSDPAQLDALRNDRSLMAQAIEEGVRWEPPLTGIGRTTTREVEIEGVVVPAGAPITVCLAGANRDPKRYEDPDRFDIFRKPQQHMAFAFGPHMCLGIHLARMETAVVVNAVLDRLPNLRIDPNADDVHISGHMFRAPETLPVVWG